MGVMLTLEGPRQGKNRRRAQHRRPPEEQACLDAFAAFLRYDAPGAGRCLSRLGAAVLVRRLLPAAKALADAVDIVLAEERQDAGATPDGHAKRDVAMNFTVSAACLLGRCRDDGCSSPLCEHDCHRRQRVTAEAAAARFAAEAATAG